MNYVSANRSELMQLAESVAQEKNIDLGTVLDAMEQAMASVANKRFGPELDLRARYDRETGSLSILRVRRVVDEIENNAVEIRVDDARKHDPNIDVDAEVVDELPALGPEQIDRAFIQEAKQTMHRILREAELQRQYEEYKDKVGQIVVGTVKGVEYGNIIVELAVGEAQIPRNHKIRQENPDKGSRIKARIEEINRENKGQQIKLSRTSTEFMRELFRNEVPEYYDGNIEIKCLARDPGSRAKIAVVSYDTSIDPVGACVGIRGSRVQAVVNELQGERIDVIPWSDNEFEFMTHALQPAQVSRGLLDNQGKLKTVVVPDDQLSLAIGKRGQNVRLARGVTGLQIEIISETHERMQREEMNKEIQQKFMDAMDIDETFAQLLVMEEFDSVDYIAACSQDELLAINGIDEEIAQELQSRAIQHIEKENQEALAEARRHGLQEDLETFSPLTPGMLLALAKEKITTLNEFATLANWELSGGYTEERGKQVWEPGLLETFDVTSDIADEMIVTARLALGIMTEDDIQRLYADNLEPEVESEPREIEES